MVRVYNAQDSIEAQYLCSLLEDAGIPSYSQENSSGEYLKIASGLNIYGTDLYVDDGDEARAKEIITAAIREKKMEQKESMPRIPWYKNRTILARILLAWAVIMGLILGIASL